jgi:EpsD family peptidyl-prolyl cis-trans isomerase
MFLAAVSANGRAGALIKGTTLNQFDFLPVAPASSRSRPARMLCLSLVLLSLAGLSACNSKDKAAKTGQALVSVNGEEVTALQLNEELQRSGVSAAQAQDPAVTKQLLESLVERQLVLNAAMQEHLDRDPQVVRAIERAKGLLIAQAYMQKKLGAATKPTAAEVTDYFNANPEFFAQRKQLEMRQLVIASDAITPAVKTVIDNAKSLDEVAAELERQQIAFSRNQITRSTSDLPKELTSKLLVMPKGQLFLVREGPRSVLSVVTEVRDAPVTRDVAAPQIEQFLVGSRNKAAATAELARLRAAAKIEYLNKADQPAPAPAPAAVAKPANTNDATARGVAGLK